MQESVSFTFTQPHCHYFMSRAPRENFSNFSLQENLRNKICLFFLTELFLGGIFNKKLKQLTFKANDRCIVYWVDSEMYKFEILNMNRQEQDFQSIKFRCFCWIRLLRLNLWPCIFIVYFCNPWTCVLQRNPQYEITSIMCNTLCC